MRSYSVTGLFQKIVGFRKPANREQNSPVLVAGQFVMMTAPQARRYRELRQAKASG
mgnify:CR=1